MAQRYPDTRNFSPSNLSEFVDLLGLKHIENLLQINVGTLENLKRLTKEDIGSLNLKKSTEECLINGIAMININEDVLSTTQRRSQPFKHQVKTVEEICPVPDHARHTTSSGQTPMHYEYHNLTEEAFANERRIVLIGKTGTGKSATGNSILGKKYFQSIISGSSITKRCRRGIANRFGKDLNVIDTPGLFDTDTPNEIIHREIVKCIALTSPGAHAFVLVLMPNRFTKEEEDAVKHFVDRFGEEIYRYFILLFTRKDDLDNDNVSLDQLLYSMPENLKRIFEKSGRRCIAFNNREDFHGPRNNEQVQRLIDIIEENIDRNRGCVYSNEDYKKAEQIYEHRERENRKQEEMKIAQEKAKITEDVERKFRKKMKDMDRKIKDSDEQLKIFKREQELERQKEQENYQKELDKMKESQNKMAKRDEERRRENERLRDEYERHRVEQREQERKREIEMIRENEKLRKDAERCEAEKVREIERNKKDFEIELLRRNRESERKEVEKEKGLFDKFCSVVEAGVEVVGAVVGGVVGLITSPFKALFD